jgi:hypothetical protein
MLWARMLAYVTGMVNQELLLRNEYLRAENRILRGKIKGPLLLSQARDASVLMMVTNIFRVRSLQMAFSQCNHVVQAGLVYSFLTGIHSWNERSKESTLGVNQGKQVEVTLAFL